MPYRYTQRDLNDAQQRVYRDCLSSGMADKTNADYFTKLIDVYAGNFKVHAGHFLETHECLGNSAQEFCYFFYMTWLDELEKNYSYSKLAKFVGNYLRSETSDFEVPEAEKRLQKSVQDLFRMRAGF